MLDSIVENNELKLSLLAALSGGRLSHSVLLCGEDGTGLNYAARCLAADYLYPQGGSAASALMRGEGAECIILEGEGASGDIKINAVREVRREIYNTSISASGRVVLVRSAHRLNSAAANAVLKVLEEPPENVLFVLTAPSEGAVLPTIRSRCATYTISAVSEHECTNYLIANGAPPAQAAKLSHAFSGRIGLANRVLQNEAEAALFKAAEDICACFANKDEISCGSLFTAYEKDRHTAQKLFIYLRILIAPYLSTELAHSAQKALCAVYEASQQLSRNAQAKLVLTILAATICE